MLFVLDSRCDYPSEVCFGRRGCISKGLMGKWEWGGQSINVHGKFQTIKKIIGIFWLKDDEDIYMIGENFFSSPEDQYIYRFQKSDNSLEETVKHF